MVKMTCWIENISEQGENAFLMSQETGEGALNWLQIITRYNQASFFWDFLPVKSEFFLPVVAR